MSSTHRDTPQRQAAIQAQVLIKTSISSQNKPKTFSEEEAEDKTVSSFEGDTESDESMAELDKRAKQLRKVKAAKKSISATAFKSKSKHTSATTTTSGRSEPRPGTTGVQNEPEQAELAAQPAAEQADATRR